ncbi:hypothetical protein [Bacillus thuringiensis]|uniref:hypothetical protein n=1 Tax=Bacillus thuringiensis TaxID=1428 RepID=UPI000BFD1586|nr:hypothetical protein [Bacillus thuringiensis]PGT89885.1 hypothetical protein COD17_09040 [Bacillus thuringiensis]
MNTVPFNKKIRKHKELRMGVTVQTDKGFGIITYRDGERLTVALPSTTLWCERWEFAITDVQVTQEEISQTSKLSLGAWDWIMVEAHSLNVRYEKERSRDAVKHLVAGKGVKLTEREEPTRSGSMKYIRLTLPNVFDFEFGVTIVDIGLADTIDYAYALAGGLDTTGYMKRDIGYGGRIIKTPLTPKDVNYGEAFGWAKAK